MICLKPVKRQEFKQHIWELGMSEEDRNTVLMGQYSEQSFVTKLLII
jgi:hypothetical protein